MISVTEMLNSGSEGPTGEPLAVRQDLPPEEESDVQFVQDPDTGQPIQYWSFRFTASKIHDGGEGIKELLDIDSIPEFGFQKEKGKRRFKVEHFQGAFECRPRKRFKQLQKMFNDKYPELIFDGRDYLNRSQSSAADRYGMKEDTRIEGPWYKGERFENIAKETVYKVELELRPWQNKTCGILDAGQDDRSIWWLWEPYGGLGKTTFQKWIYQNYKGVMISGGKAADMKNGVIRYKERNGEYPKIVLVNIPKTFDIQYFSAAGVEEVKDMFFFSGKYGSKDECGEVCGRPPIVLIFANREPPTWEMSHDRWKIRRLPDGKAKQVTTLDTETWDE